MKNILVIGVMLLLVGCTTQLQPTPEFELLPGETVQRHPLSILDFVERSLLHELEPGQTPCLHEITYYGPSRVHSFSIYEFRYIVDADMYTVTYWEADRQVTIDTTPWDTFQPVCYHVDPREIKVWPKDVMSQYASDYTISGMSLFTNKQAQAFGFAPLTDYWWSMITKEDLVFIDVRNGHAIHSFKHGSMLEE